MGTDVIYNKVEIIGRCIKRINDVYQGNYENLKDYTKQDSIILNIQRACEACIDIAMHVVAEKKLGIPQNSRDAFDILSANDTIDEALIKRLKAMVGFRNIAVHNYQAVNLEIVREVIEKHLVDFEEFTSAVIKI